MILKWQRMPTVGWFVWLIALWSIASVCLAQQSPDISPSQSLAIFNVTLSKSSFDPSRGQAVELNYRLSRSAKVTVKIFDPDRELIRVLSKDVEQSQGPHKLAWDGKDLDARVVPNEAYFFTIEAEDATGSQIVYDPITFSGGEPFEITEGRIDREGGTLSYRLSKPSRVSVRAGVASSALLRTLVDWEPRIAGTITEYWNGKDRDNLINLWDLEDHKIVISYFTLPETSVIAYGNSTLDYRTYKHGLSTARPKKADRPMVNRRRVSPHFLASRLQDRELAATLSFPEFDKSEEKAVPEVKDAVVVRIDVPSQEDREILLGQRFEIILFIDTVYYAEEERGYIPFNYPLDVSGVPEGEHVLTVNIITPKNQFAIASRKLKVVKQP
ncbi:FlgD immunoglobulin-like domain containing protein [Candidatus Thiosymbion oneisti]|uniref:FlgD immunoglobulin-like domain containing protein n=1 Tax=Candidatus Thiosymbion oneisti TaxID=589554 RepID=UPI000ACC6843|nr:FlgD immunoglobulin-like domain containing protein [Candidatus Thiosymbion oneisti]